jgi:SAM-dependent methyltransferase
MANASRPRRFTGFDHSDAVIAAARKAADDAGLADRVSFEVADAASFPVAPGQGYDLVCFTDSLHDLGDPVAAAAHARSALAPGGTVMVVEPLAADRFEDNFTNPYARVGYAISTMVCTPSSLAQPGAAALGAMAGETRIRQVLADARLHPGAPGGRGGRAVQHRAGGPAMSGPMYLGAVHFDGDPDDLLPAYQRMLEKFGWRRSTCTCASPGTAG